MKKLLILASMIFMFVGDNVKGSELFTQQATVAGVVPNVISISGSPGASYTNTFNNVVTGAISVGDNFVAVGAVTIPSVTDNTGFVTMLSSVLPMGTVLNAVFAIEGTVTANGAGVTAVSFDAGVLTVHQATGFSTSDPSTWGTANAPVGLFVLKPNEAVSQGDLDASAHNLSPSQTNQISLNLAVAALTQGIALFEETPSPDLLTMLTQNGLPFGSSIIADAIVVQLNERVENPAAGPYNIDVADLLVLDSIIAAAAGFDPRFTQIQFASGLGNTPATDAPSLYSPGAGFGGGVGSGDFPTFLSTETSPALQVEATPVPEPASMLVWSMMGLCGLGVALMRSRRRRQEAAAVSE